MKVSLLFALLLFANTSVASSDLTQVMGSIAGVMNSHQINSTDIESLGKSFRFSDDIKIYEKIKKNKRFFKDDSWFVKNEFHSLILKHNSNVVMTIDFGSDAGFMRINGKDLNISSQKSILSQVQAALKSTKKSTSHLFNLFVPNVYAQLDWPATTQEIDFAVSAYAARSKRLILSGYKSSGQSFSIVSKSELPYSVQPNAALKCDSSGKVTGTFTTNINDVKSSLSFESSLEKGGPFDEPFKIKSKVTSKDVVQEDEEKCRYSKIYRNLRLLENAEKGKKVTALKASAYDETSQAIQNNQADKTGEILKKTQEQIDSIGAKTLKDSSLVDKAISQLKDNCKDFIYHREREAALSDREFESCLSKFRKETETVTCRTYSDTEDKLLSALNPKLAAANKASLDTYNKIENEIKNVALDNNEYADAAFGCSAKLMTKSEKIKKLCIDLAKSHESIFDMNMITNSALHDAKESIRSAVACCNTDSCKSEFFPAGVSKAGTSTGTIKGNQ